MTQNHRIKSSQVLVVELNEIGRPVEVVNSALNGSVSINDGEVTYTPNEEFTGLDYFSFTSGEEIIEVNVAVGPNISFKPKAHILKLLGEELIKNPVMAIYELIKNSYDADAKEVSVLFEDITSESSFIRISDDGTGLTEDVLLNVWLEPGTDFRKPVDEEGVRTINRSPIFNRVPMGEKGVGRFAVHKLGDRIKLITRPSEIILSEHGEYIAVPLNYELELEIDWKAFSQTKYLHEVPIEWVKRESQSEFIHKESSGTIVIIEALKEPWTRGMARQLKRSTLSMLSPKAESTFKINLDFNNDWLSDYPDTNEIISQAPYKLTALLDKNFDLTFEYTFDPQNNEDIGSRHIIESEFYDKNKRGEIRPFYRKYLEQKEYEAHDLAEKLHQFDEMEIPFGGFMVEINSFDLDSKSLRDTSLTPDLIKKVLKDHAGIRVFKDDLRVYDYGEPGNDWLGLDLKRVNNKEWFSNNQNIGFIYLDSEDSSCLVEKTNREGFIESAEFDLFITILNWLLAQFKQERLSDREKWLRLNANESKDSLSKAVNNFRNIITSSSMDEDGKSRLLLEAEKVEKEYQKRQETLLLPAGVGLTASVALHEIDKLVPRMEETVRSVPIDQIKAAYQVEELKQYMEGILSVLKKGGDKEIDVAQSLTQAIKNYSVKLEFREIGCKILMDNTENPLVKCDKRYFVTMLMNLIDNSIYWLDTIYEEQKNILIKVADLENYVSIIVADNGPGYIDLPEDIVRPFHSRKEGGIGLGMYIIDTLMIKYGKLKIYTPENSPLEGDLRVRYSGAVTELLFKKN